MAMITMTIFLRTEMHKNSTEDGNIYTGCDAPKPGGLLTTPSTRGIQVEVGLPDATLENRAESPLYGELYPNTKPVYPVPNSLIYAIYIQYGHLGP